MTSSRSRRSMSTDLVPLAVLMCGRHLPVARGRAARAGDRSAAATGARLPPARRAGRPGRARGRQHARSRRRRGTPSFDVGIAWVAVARLPRDRRLAAQPAPRAGRRGRDRGRRAVGAAIAAPPRLTASAPRAGSASAGLGLDLDEQACGSISARDVDQRRRRPDVAEDLAVDRGDRRAPRAMSVDVHPRPDDVVEPEARPPRARAR